MNAGALNAIELLHLQHLVVDEFQDLNPMDLQFVDALAAQGAQIFVAGDDDQGIYSFRFASPAGIQVFVATYPNCGQHTLTSCFRCTPSVLAAAQTLIAANPQPHRIPKNHVSLYATAVPPVAGVVHRWRFQSGVAEARAVAQSCRDLIAAGMAPREILVLLSNQNALLPTLEAELQAAGVAFEPPRAEGFLSTKAGRLILAMIRIVCDGDDYVAHRVLLGLRPGVGIGTCNTVTDAVIANNLNYRALFYEALPQGVLVGRALAAVNNARALCSQLQEWQRTDTVGVRIADAEAIVASVWGAAEAQTWQTYANTLPPDMTLEELRDYIWADTDEQQSSLLRTVFTRLNLPIPAAGVLPPRVRVMTMHGAKGLSAQVVFIPGLEEELLPGPWRQPYPGLVLEAARLFYVSITRARAVCLMSFARTRIVHGQFQGRHACRFVANVGGAFVQRNTGLNAAEIQQVTNQVAQL